jgi:hypothetical protein
MRDNLQSSISAETAEIATAFVPSRRRVDFCADLGRCKRTEVADAQTIIGRNPAKRDSRRAHTVTPHRSPVSPLRLRNRSDGICDLSVVLICKGRQKTIICAAPSLERPDIASVSHRTTMLNSAT